MKLIRMLFVLLPLMLSMTIDGSWGATGPTVVELAGPVEQYCSGWITNTDSDNIVGWSVTPPMCQKSIANYIEGGQYLVDFSIAANASYTFLSIRVQTLEPTKFDAIVLLNLPQVDFSIALNASYAYLQTLEPTDGKDAMVFDIDETSLSNLPYYKNHSYGGESFNATSFNDYVDEANAPPLPTLTLYKLLQAQNWSLIFITGRDEFQRNITTANLIAAGYSDWSELILRQVVDQGVLAAIYKSKQRTILEQTKGYRIRSCMGDQWSDCEGDATGNRTFKLPNPMYYIG